MIIIEETKVNKTTGNAESTKGIKISKIIILFIFTQRLLIIITYLLKTIPYLLVITVLIIHGHWMVIGVFNVIVQARVVQAESRPTRKLKTALRIWIYINK